VEKLYKFLFHAGKLDTPQNVISLEPSLHSLWSRGNIAFEPDQQLDNGVVLKFRWLRRRCVPRSNIYSPRMSMELTTHPEDILPVSNVNPMPHFKTCRPILDGQDVVIASDGESLHPNWEDVLLFQWDFCRMASLAAARTKYRSGSWMTIPFAMTPRKMKISPVQTCYLDVRVPRRFRLWKVRVH